MKWVFESRTGLDGLFLRLALGVMIFPHGAQKLFGWFGGYGFSGTMTFFTENMGVPWIFALAAVLTEFFGGLALIAGIGTRLAALGVGTTMLVAAGFHWGYGFFMNWSGNQAGEGIEFHLLAIGIAAALVVRGAGTLGLDPLIAKKLK